MVFKGRQGFLEGSLFFLGRWTVDASLEPNQLFLAVLVAVEILLLFVLCCPKLACQALHPSGLHKRGVRGRFAHRLPSFPEEGCLSWFFLAFAFGFLLSPSHAESFGGLSCGAQVHWPVQEKKYCSIIELLANRTLPYVAASDFKISLSLSLSGSEDEVH